MGIFHTQSQVIEEFEEKYNYYYDYSLVEYINADTPITIICREHGKFERLSWQHKKGRGCIKCKYKQKFIKKAIAIHGKKYNYDDVIYETAKDKVIINCLKCDTPFPQTPNLHLRPSGCPKCNPPKASHSIEKYRNKKTTLYYIKVDDVYKIGLTMKTVKARYYEDKNVKIEIIATKIYEDGAIAFLKEKEILQSYNKYQYTGAKILKGGNSELFCKDIFSNISHNFS